MENTSIILLIVFAAGLLVGRAMRPRPDERLTAIERRVNMLTDHFQLKWDPTVGVPEDVLSKVRAGEKIEAIKRYREHTGKGLKESHDLIEEIDRRIRFRL